MARYIDAEVLRRKLIIEKSFFPSIVRAGLEETPTADVEEVRHGYWEASVMGTGAPHCSLCNGVAPSRYTRCPHCGAKMDGGKANDL